jgi:thiol:disulfide interchange protein DsbD
VAAPLAGALVYISQTHDILIGGWALFSMAMGMSVPLLLTGVSAGSLLPHAGAWMNEVKHLFGLMLIGVAIWMVTPVLPVWATLVAWGAFAIVCAVFLRVFDAVPAGHIGVGTRFGKAAGLVFLIFGVFELIGAASGGQEVLKPLARIQTVATASASTQHESRFTRIHTIAELEHAVKSSTSPVLLDFYADWCVACKEMEHNTFSDPKVSEQFQHLTLLQVDVTANSEEDRALMKQFGLFGPPGIILFGASGQEVPKSRIIGYLEANAFLAHIKKHLVDA